MKSTQSITSLPESPDADRRRRLIAYLIAMGVRVACVILCFFVRGWWLFIPILGALVLPYIAVVLANATSGASTKLEVFRPGALVQYRDNGPTPE